MYFIEPIFWLKLILVIGITLLVVTGFQALMSKWLKVENKKLFSYNHINDKHRKLDWTIRITFLTLLLFGFFYNISVEPYDTVWFLEPWFLLIIFIVFSQVARATMEWKYAENRKAYMFTLSELLFFGVVFIFFINTNFFGLF
ncbi:DUF4181 domain-containing protein [Virgibacillus kimchii]